MSTLTQKLRPVNIPILFTILLLFAIFIVSSVLTQLSGLPQEFVYAWCAVLSIAVAFAFRMPRQMRLTSSFRWSSLKYYFLPLIYIVTIPLLLGGYNFEKIGQEVLVSMSGIGIFEEIITHGICMALLLKKHGSRYKYKAAIYSSLCFGVVHLNLILQDPTNTHLILKQVSTVFFATFVSVGFAGLAYKSNSIWLVAVLHALIDIAGNVGDPQVIESVFKEWNWYHSLVSILYFLPLGLYGLWLLRKTKVSYAGKS